MPTRNVHLTAELDCFFAANIESGRYENASEVVRAGLRALEERDLDLQRKLTSLRSALEEGEQSGIADNFMMDTLLASSTARWREAAVSPVEEGQRGLARDRTVYPRTHSARANASIAAPGR